jgi:hypothetical protein
LQSGTLRRRTLEREDLATRSIPVAYKSVPGEEGIERATGT